MASQENHNTISAVLIVKNEENRLEDCLASLDWVDEIVILDSGSTDRTREIAEKHNAKFHINTDWQGDGIQKQRAQEFSTCDYILVIDADERISPELKESIQKVLRGPYDKSRVYSICRRDFFIKEFTFRNSWYRKWLVRLYPRESGLKYSGLKVHASLETQSATIQKIKGVLLHYSNPDYRFYLEKHVGYADEWAIERHQQGKKASPARALLHALWCFFHQYIYRGSFLAGRCGLIFALTQANYVFNKYAFLYFYNEMRNHPRKDHPMDL